MRIIDYKTADKHDTPEKTHRKNDAWVDLQLPLYRHLCSTDLAKQFEPLRVELAYFNLPRELDQTCVAAAQWDDVVLSNADETARRVIMAIRAGAFEPLTLPPPAFSEDFAAICLDGVLSAPALGDDEEAE